jgi:hypothetical protein
MALQSLVIDEISMLSPELLVKASDVLKICARLWRAIWRPSSCACW